MITLTRPQINAIFGKNLLFIIIFFPLLPSFTPSFSSISPKENATKRHREKAWQLSVGVAQDPVTAASPPSRCSRAGSCVLAAPTRCSSFKRAMTSMSTISRWRKGEFCLFVRPLIRSSYGPTPPSSSIHLYSLYLFRFICSVLCAVLADFAGVVIFSLMKMWFCFSFFLLFFCSVFMCLVPMIQWSINIHRRQRYAFFML